MTADNARAGSIHAAKVVSDALFRLLCDCEGDGCDPSCQVNEHFHEAGQVALDALRALPVEQRMEAMGMRPVVKVPADAEWFVSWRQSWIETDA